MPTMTVTIPDAPGFAAVKEGYTFSGTVSLPETVNAPIKINSISLYYNYGRRYVRYVYLTATCGDTTFQTNYFSLQADESLKKITVACSNITAGSDHLLKQNGRPITFKVACDYSTSGVVVDRARGGEMTLTINYEILFEKSPYTLSSDLIDLGQSLVLNVEETTLNADYIHKAVLDMAGLQVEGERTGPGEILLEIPRDAQWLAQIPDTVQRTGTVTLTTEGSGETGTEEKTLTLSVPADVVPVITKSAIQRIDGRVPAAWGLYAQGESAALLTIDEAVAGEGSSIAGYRIEGAGFAANDWQLQTGKLLLTGYQTFRLMVTDARGRTGEATYEIYVHPYAQPALAAFEAQRASDDGSADDSGVKIAGRAEYTITNIGENTPAFTIYADGQVTEPEMLQAEDGIVAFLLTGPYDQAHSVEVTLEIRDGITAASVMAGSLTDLVPTANVAFNLKRGGTAAAFGRYAEREKTLAIPEDWRYYRGETDIEQKVDEALAKAEEALEKAGSDSGAVKYRIGDVHISFDPTSPASLYGGVWERLKDRFLLGAGDTYTAGDTGGSATHTLTVDEMPSHTHEVWGWKRAAAKGSSAAATVANNGDGAAVAYNRYEADQMTGTAGGCTSPVVERGGGQAHSIMPPYLTVYMWRRTA